MSKPPIFKDPALQAAFEADGFVKFRMLSEEQVDRLKDYYLHTQSAHETVIERKKFHATNDTDNATLIADADRLIKEVMFEEIDKHFFNYKTIAANYLVKQAHEASDLAPHQDLRFVDEEKYYSFNIWVATEDTTPQNGCLRFLKGSHRWVDTIRPLPSYPWKYQNLIALIPPFLVDVPTVKGEVVILNHACIHASYPNLSDHPRVAAILALIPADSSIYHYFLPDGNPEFDTEQYEMTLQDFVTLKVGHRPESARLIRKFKADFTPVSASSFYQFLGVLPPVVPANQTTSSNNFYASIKRKISAIFR